MSVIIPEIFLSLGISGIGGFLVGYAAKKILKIIMVFLGLYLISLLYLMHIEVIKIDFANIFAVVNNFYCCRSRHGTGNNISDQGVILSPGYFLTQLFS